MKNNNKFIAILFFLFALCQNCVAQFAANLGGALTNTEQVEGDNKLGGAGGIKFDLSPFGEDALVKVSPEIFIQQNGSRNFLTRNSLQSGIANGNLTLSYIGLAVPFKLWFGSNEDDDKTGMGINAGFYFDYILDATLGDSEVNFSQGTDKFDFGFNLNLTLAQSDGWGIVLGYGQGLADINFYTNLSKNYLINNKGFTLQMTKLF